MLSIDPAMPEIPALYHGLDRLRAKQVCTNTHNQGGTENVYKTYSIFCTLACPFFVQIIFHLIVYSFICLFILLFIHSFIHFTSPSFFILISVISDIDANMQPNSSCFILRLVMPVIDSKHATQFKLLHPYIGDADH